MIIGAIPIITLLLRKVLRAKGGEYKVVRKGKIARLFYRGVLGEVWVVLDGRSRPSSEANRIVFQLNALQQNDKH